MPFNSTTHFHMMVALEQAKINPADVQILNMRPPEVRAAWQRQRRHRRDVFDAVLAEAQERRRVVSVAGKNYTDTGKATFDGYIVDRDWAKANKDFVVKFVKVLAAADDNYRKNKAKFGKGFGGSQGDCQVVGCKAGGRSGQHGTLCVPDRAGAGDQMARRRQGFDHSGGALTADFQFSQKQSERSSGLLDRGQSILCSGSDEIEGLR